MIRPLYNWLMQKSGSPAAPFWLGVLATCESVFLPIPPDVMLAPMVLAKPDHAYRNAAICMVCSVLGGCISYAIGYHLAPYAVQLLAFTGNHLDMEQYRRWFAQYGVLVILGKGLTPFPYMIVTFASGLAHFSFAQFIPASLVTRGGRFFLTAFLLKRYGPAIQEQVEKNLLLWGSVLIVVLVAIWVTIHFVLK